MQKVCISSFPSFIKQNSGKQKKGKTAPNCLLLVTYHPIVPAIYSDTGSFLQVQLLRNAGGERRGRPHDQEMSFVMHPMRPLHASLISQPSATGRTDVNASKWDRVIPLNVGPTLQFPPRASHVLPFGYQSSANRFGDANAGPSTISQAADEGSRTGIKGSGILSSINASGGISDRSLTGVPLSGAKQKSALHLSDLESSNPW